MPENKSLSDSFNLENKEYIYWAQGKKTVGGSGQLYNVWLDISSQEMMDEFASYHNALMAF